jgi:tetratricopeptide (TPR) repeat protein
MSFSSLISFFDPFGTVPGSSLNWSQHALLERNAGRRTSIVAAGPTIDTNRICAALDDVGANVQDVVQAIDWLVSDLDLRLDAQTKLLNQQVDLLTEIAQTLRSPSRTRAAERLRDASELLRHHRNERALTVAEQAIEDDPNNDAAFMLAGWASLGLEDLQRARGHFREAAQATAYERNAEARHMNAVYVAARLTFVVDGPEAALRELDGAKPFFDSELRSARPTFSEQQLDLLVLKPNKAGAIKFDRTIYLTAAGQADAATQLFREIAEQHDIRFCLMALTDPMLTTNDGAVGVATETLLKRRALTDDVRDRLQLRQARWETLGNEIRRHEIQDAGTVAAKDRLEAIFAAGSAKRLAVDKTWPPKDVLEEFAASLRNFDDFEARTRQLVECERAREAVLDAAIEEVMRQRRKDKLVDRMRVEAIIGHRTLSGGYLFQRIVVDENGKTALLEESARDELTRKYAAAKKR